MDSLLTTLQTTFPFFVDHKYLLLFFATIIDGFGTFLVAGFLVSVRALPALPTFCVLVAADILNGVLWYWLGHYAGTPVLNWMARRSERSAQRIHRIRTYAQQFTGRAVLLANLTSLTTITNLISGTLRYPFRKFMVYNGIGSFFKPTIILALGYFYGKGYQELFAKVNSPATAVVSAAILVPFMWGIRSVLMWVTNRYLALWEAILHMRRKIKLEIDKLIEGQGNEPKF